MSLKSKIVDLIVKSAVKVFRLNKANMLSCHLAELLNPVYTISENGDTFLFYCPNDITRWRLDTYFTKEPETIAWINSFKQGEVLFDIGANIGLYSVYAAKKGVQVVAFEPESQNYALLNKNIFLNKAQDSVICLNVALSDADRLDYQYIPVFQAGRALNCFGAATDENGAIFKPAFKQGVISFSLDSYLSRYRDIFPTHIKIDVDGLEPKIILGAAATLQDKRLKSVSIEINETLPEHVALAKPLVSKGFEFVHKKHADMFDGSKYDKIFNYLFVRK